MQGIMFKPWKIKAIAESDKEWQTRRTSGLKEINNDPSSWNFCGNAIRIIPPVREGDALFQHGDGHCVAVRPRYHVGEVVYIKEAWRFLNVIGDANPNDFGIEYFTGQHQLHWWKDNGGVMNYPLDEKMRSPMFLPEKYARYFIQVTDVRAERLQEITPEDCVAEGYPGGAIPDGRDEKQMKISELMRIGWYQSIWDSINGEGDYALNKWVWVYEFKRVEGK